MTLFLMAILTCSGRALPLSLQLVHPEEWLILRSWYFLANFGVGPEYFLA